MKKLLTMVLSFCCLYSLCSCEREEEPADTFEFNVQKLFGDYNLTNIHWSGLAVDLNNDDEGVVDYDTGVAAEVDSSMNSNFKMGKAAATTATVPLPGPDHFDDFLPVGSFPHGRGGTGIKGQRFIYIDQ